MAHNSVAMFFLAFTMMQQLSPGQYDPWNAWGRRVRPPHGIETMPIRQSHVQQDDVHSSLRKMNLSFAHAQEVRQFETVRPLSLNISRSKRTSPASSSTRRTWSAFSFMSVATEGYTELGLSFPTCGSRSRGLSARVRAIARGY